ncbi:MAG: hypothetical protein IJS26_06290 [Alphaproteobacteria bacterium]|nr:hypothetical protein [Alphaproteobacteria bacterium]
MKTDFIKDLKLKGFSKFLHKIFLFLTYPLRHPLRFFAYLFVVLFLLVAFALFKRVPFSQIPSWYLTKASLESPKEDVEFIKKVLLSQTEKIDAEQKLNSFKKVFTLSKAKQQSLASGQIQDESEHTKKQEPVLPTKKYMVWNIQKPDSNEAQRHPFEKQKLSTEAPAPIAPILPPQKAEPLPAPSKKETDFYKKVEGFGLTYLPTPEIITGEVIVYGPNEIYVAGTYLYLYGIYTDPIKHNFSKARQYLRDLIDGKKISCRIVALTKDGVATGVCFTNGRSINQNMVDAGMADNIAL